MNRLLGYAIESVEIERDRLAHGTSEPEAIKSLDQVGAHIVVNDKGCSITFAGIEAGPAVDLIEAIGTWLIGARHVFTAGAGQ